MAFQRLLFSAVVFVSSSALARIACPVVELISPPNGATQVPLNAVVRVITSRTESFAVLRDANGSDVPSTTELGADGTLTLKPTALLEMNTRYSLRTADLEASFTTSDRADDSPPTAPTVKAAWVNAKSIAFELSDATDDVTPSDQLLYAVFVGKDEQHLDTTTPAAFLLPPELSSLGDGLCGANLTVGAVAVEAIDWADHHSDRAVPKQQPLCGCSGGPAGLGFAALAVWLHRRKKPLSGPRVR